MSHAILTLVLFLLAAMPFTDAFPQESSKGTESETVLDRKVHIEKDLVLEIAKVPRLCDELHMGGRRVSVGDCDLYCEVEGQGPAIVLLHGGPGATHHYFHPWFSRAKDFAKVIYYDQRGCGQSDYKARKGYSVDQAVDDLENLRRALNVGKWIVLGHSYGGFLAQCYAVKYPDGLSGLVLLGAQPGMHVRLNPSRAGEYMSAEEIQKIMGIRRNQKLTPEQKLFNAFLNGDWKRQNFHRPSKERIAQMVFYEWKHDPQFRAAVGQDMQKIELQGAFEGCPIPTLIMEGKWDLTWNTDKPEKLQKDHPGSKLVMFDASSHDPFEDEPERFFEELKGFIQGLPPIPNQDLAQWRKYLADREERLARSPAHIVRSMGYGVKSNALIAEAYTREWLNQLDDPGLLLKTGFALYDQRRYEDALAVFRKMTEQTKDNPFYLAVSLIWQGHMLDLLGRRKEAVEVYKRVADMGVTGGMEHSQFGLRYSPSPYAKERMEKPFERMENRDQN